MQPRLTQFNAADYFELSRDARSKDNLPMARLNGKGITLVSEYYSDKYKLKQLIIKKNLRELIDFLKSEDFSKIKNAEGDIRLPIIHTSEQHSTPIIYIKEGGREALLVLDSLNSHTAELINPFIPSTLIYTTSDKRQLDMYSCHTDALVYLRQLTGKMENGQFIIPNLLTKLENEKRISEHHSKEINIKEIELFDDLLVTVQHPSYIKKHSPKGTDIVHINKSKAENYNDFIARYPPDQVADKEKIEYVSSYLREKGLKFTKIIEIQFYLNQLKDSLGTKFNETLKNNFINEAKKLNETNANTSLFDKNNIKIFELAQKYLENYLQPNYEGPNLSL